MIERWSALLHGEGRVGCCLCRQGAFRRRVWRSAWRPGSCGGGLIADALRAAVAAANADPAWTAEAERLNLPLRPMAAEAQRRLFLREDARLRAPWARRPWRA